VLILNQEFDHSTAETDRRETDCRSREEGAQDRGGLQTQREEGKGRSRCGAHHVQRMLRRVEARTTSEDRMRSQLLRRLHRVMGQTERHQVLHPVPVLQSRDRHTHCAEQGSAEEGNQRTSIAYRSIA